MPFDKSKYPANWSQIRADILERAGHKCELCGVQNYALGYRSKSGVFVKCEGMQLETDSLVDEEKIIKIVLTIAHIDNPDPMDCRPENLKALCQRCHNQIDAPMRAKNAAKTRAMKKQFKAERDGQLSWF